MITEVREFKNHETYLRSYVRLYLHLLMGLCSYTLCKMEVYGTEH